MDPKKHDKVREENHAVLTIPGTTVSCDVLLKAGNGGYVILISQLKPGVANADWTADLDGRPIKI